MKNQSTANQLKSMRLHKVSSASLLNPQVAPTPLHVVMLTHKARSYDISSIRPCTFLHVPRVFSVGRDLQVVVGMTLVLSVQGPM